jgi:hypothetical protein
MSDIIREPDGGFGEWKENQNFDYQRTRTAVMDYINNCIDYATLDMAIEQDEDIAVASEFSSLDEDGVELAQEHIRQYIGAKNSET